MLGDDHPYTLISARNVAADLRGLGEYHAALEMDRDTLARFRRVLGEDHPDTLRSVSNLAINVHAVGKAGDDPKVQAPG